MHHARITTDGMDAFDKKFITELFLDSDSTTTMNRLVAAVANVVTENNENLKAFNKAFDDELAQVQQAINKAPTVPKVITYCEDVFIMNNYEDEDYVSRFKMRKTTAEALINLLKEHSKSTSPNVQLEKKVHIFLWLVTSDSSYSEVGLLFGLNKSSVSYIFHEIASLLTELRYHFISWPSAEEQHITRIKVNSRYKFPNCVGFIDTCRFNIGSKRKKKENLETILLQAVCDESLMFIDIHIGEIGQTKKSKVFKDSTLSQELRNFVDFENHILGDSEYKLKKNLITPFSSEELLTSEEMKFNDVHWKVRGYIGNAFELLKERFKRLNHIDITKSESVSNLIWAACALHNFILLHEGCAEIKEEVVVCDDGITIDTSIVKTAVEKRQFLCNYVNFIDMDLETTLSLPLDV